MIPSDRRKPSGGFLLSVFLSQNGCACDRDKMLAQEMRARRENLCCVEEVKHTSADSGQKAKIIQFCE